MMYQNFRKRLMPGIIFLIGVFVGILGVRLPQAVRDVALFDAVYRGDAATAESLLNNGANPNTHFAPSAMNSHLDYAAALVEATTGYRWHRITPLLAAAMKPGRSRFVHLLLTHGANPNTAGSAGLTPLMASASFAGDCETVDTLIAAGANVNARWKDGSTILDMARGTEIIKRLEKAGAKHRH